MPFGTKKLRNGFKRSSSKDSDSGQQHQQSADAINNSNSNGNISTSSIDNKSSRHSSNNNNNHNNSMSDTDGWRFLQVFGDKGQVEEISEADLISTVTFDDTGKCYVECCKKSLAIRL